MVAKNTHHSFLFFCRFFRSLEMFSYRGQDFEATMSVLLEDFWDSCTPSSSSKAFFCSNPRTKTWFSRKETQWIKKRQRWSIMKMCLKLRTLEKWQSGKNIQILNLFYFRRREKSYLSFLDFLLLVKDWDRSGVSIVFGFIIRPFVVFHRTKILY